MPHDIQYDPDAVQKLAARLYRRAAFVMVFYPLLGILAGGFAGLEFVGELAAVVGAGLGGFLGYLFGSLRSMMLKGHAQNALCQKRIEENTRAE